MKQKIAVIGAGVAGITSAHLLQNKFDVTIFEKNHYLGGHTNTVDVPIAANKSLPVDTGFIVCNDRTYPLFHKLLELLDCKWRYADMSFSVEDQLSGLQYGSKNLNTIFAQRKNIFSPKFWKFLVGIQKFWTIAKADINNESVHSLPLSVYLKQNKIDEEVVQNFILPISAAIWSTPDKLMLQFPVGIFLKFYGNHGLLSVVNQPKWQTVVGGSQSYVRAFASKFTGQIKLNCGKLKVVRDNLGIKIIDSNNLEELFDYVVIATHADQVLDLLDTPSDVEKNLFNKWYYLNNHTVLHTDERHLPSVKLAQASWNYRREVNDDGSRPLSISYYMNRLQGYPEQTKFIVTLNSRIDIPKDKIIAEYNYTHPHFTVESMATQEKISSLNGTNRTFFAGSYLRFGFHEDAVISGNNVASYFGASL